MSFDYHRLEIWKDSHSLTLKVSDLINQFPSHERYNLTSQIRRSASSIPTNIVEGSMRGSKRDFVRFINISIGSAAELMYHLELSRDLKYIQFERSKVLIQEIVILIKRMRTFKRRLQEEINNGVDSRD